MKDLQKEFILYDRALRMKALGFDEPCVYYVDQNNNPYIYNFELPLDEFIYICHCDVIKAPTFSQAFRWFREKHEIFGVIKSELDEYYDSTEFFWYSVYKIKVNAPLSMGLNLKEHASYEEAELACLDKLIEIVESKQKEDGK